MPVSPALSLQFHLVSLHSSALFQLLPSGQQASQKSELGLHKHCWILDHRQLNHWEEVKGTAGCSGKLLTFF